MNILYNRRLIFKFKLNSIDILKFITIIKKLHIKNNFISYRNYKKNKKNNIISDKIYFYIRNNKLLKINFSHIFYDAFSIFYILEKIDLMYCDKIDNFKFDKYNVNISQLDYWKNNFNLLSKLNVMKLIPFVTKKK